jgi:hypothetical protein
MHTSAGVTPYLWAREERVPSRGDSSEVVVEEEVVVVVPRLTTAARVP